jgi:hypothetical protein
MGTARAVNAVTNGGRVLGVTRWADLQSARLANAACERIHFEGVLAGHLGSCAAADGAAS